MRSVVFEMPRSKFARRSYLLHREALDLPTKHLRARAKSFGTWLAISLNVTVSTPSEPDKEIDMNWDQIAGNWKQFKGKVKQQWGKLTDDQLEQLAGNRDQLVGKIQEQYGISKEEAEKQLSDWAGMQRDAAAREDRKVTR
jgi:uncharacterized protein YjbJ (UPF0337 family)